MTKGLIQQRDRQHLHSGRRKNLPSCTPCAVQVLPGARVPADGVILEGTSRVDESMLTGEPVPVTKGPGDKVTGGTVNTAGVLRVRARAVEVNGHVFAALEHTA